MANIFKKLLGAETTQDTKTGDLEKFRSSGKNFDIVPKSNTQAEHLIAYGKVIQNGKTMFDIRTAAIQKGSDVEFSTNLGRTQNTPLGSAITERLGHVLDGKLVTFDNPDEPDKVDIVYATRKPYEWLDQQRFDKELESHAKVKSVVSPILDASLRLPQPKKGTDYPELQEMSKDFVGSNLELQHRLSGKLGTAKYLPKSKGSK